MAVAGGWRADPEVQAGRTLRELRLARDWSQEEVAVRMAAYGYDFHQTTIAKIEAAQRPLRVRELADFAALYGVEVQELVYPPSRSLSEIDQEIADITKRLVTAQKVEELAAAEVARTHEAVRAAEATLQAALTEVAVLHGRLASLSADRERVIDWESDRESFATVTLLTTSIAERGSTVLRLLLGAHLRRLREAAGVTVEETRKAAHTSHARIVRLETGRAAFKEHEITELLNVYGVTDEKDHQSLLELAQRANIPGWWHDYSDILPSWSEAFIELEMAAQLIRAYGAQAIPALLRTEAYSRAVTESYYKDAPTAEIEGIEQRVRLQVERQARFFERPDPPRLWVVLDEAVLRRQVGSPTVMRDQLKHIEEIAELPNMMVQVLPLEVGSHSAQGSFSILRFTEPDLPDIVYVEQLTSALYLERPQDVDAYVSVMENLSCEALSPDQTSLFLRKHL